MLGIFLKQNCLMTDQLTALPHKLKRRRLKIRPTRYGIVFIILLLGMFAGSVNYNNNLGFLLTFLLGGIALVSIAHTCKTIAGLQILSCSNKPVFAGEHASFEIVADSSGAERCNIKFCLSNGIPAALNIAKGAVSRVNIQTPATSRGLLKPWPIVIFTDFPLGLFRAQAQLYPDCACIVYPRPMAGKVEFLAEKAAVETEGRFDGPGSDDFLGLKGYLPGDPFQRISWKASSRGRGLFTKDFGGQHGDLIYLDWPLTEGRNFEHKLSLLCHAVIESQRRHLVYGLKLPGKTIEPGRGQLHLKRCLKTLALVNPP